MAERLWREMLRDVRQTSDLEYKSARLRLEQVCIWVPRLGAGLHMLRCILLPGGQHMQLA